MKVILAVVIFSMSLLVSAETSIRVQQGDGGATVIVHGMDSDASKLFEAMNVESEDDGNVLRRSIFLTRMREPIMNLMCVKSKVSNATNCTLQFIPGILTTMNYEQGFVKFEVIDSYAAPRVANLFVKGTESGPEQTVFESENGKLRFVKSLSAYGHVMGFLVVYSE